MNKYPINTLDINGIDRDDIPGFGQPLISFAGLNLNECDDVATVEDDNFLDLANVNYENYFSPRVDGGGVLEHNITDRDLNFSLLIQKNTQEEFEKELDRIKEALSTTEGELIVYIAGEYRRTNASLIKFSERSETKDDTPRGVFDVSMKAIRDREGFYTEEQTFFNITDDIVFDIRNDASKGTYPDIYFSFNTAVGQNTIVVSRDGFDYTIPQAINDGDFVAMYGENIDKIKEQNAVYNGTDIIGTTGRYPRIDKGDTNIFNITFDGTVNVDITIVYKKKYY